MVADNCTLYATYTSLLWWSRRGAEATGRRESLKGQGKGAGTAVGTAMLVPGGSESGLRVAMVAS
jgi:hypothetical protein